MSIFKDFFAHFKNENSVKAVTQKEDATKSEEAVAPTTEPVKADLYQIEHYPLNNRYYPKYNGKYLYNDGLSGILTLRNDLLYSQSYSNEYDATQCLIRFKEQRGKVNVRLINVNL